MKVSCLNLQDDDRADDELVGDEEGWTLVTYKRFWKQRNPKPTFLTRKGKSKRAIQKLLPRGREQIV